MDIVIKELDANTVKDINQCDSTFTVDSKLRFNAIDGVISYDVVSVPPSQKRYRQPEIDPGEYLGNPEKVIYLGYVDGQIGGQIVLRKNWNGYAYVEELTVDSHFRRRGIGRRLMARAIEWAKSKNLPGIMVETQDKNVAACRFYETLGFTLRGFDSNLYRAIDPDTDEIALFWYLLF